MQRTGAARLAAILGFTPAEAGRLRCAAALHDVGKTAIPAAILGKPAALTRAERRTVERHTLIGHRMLIAVSGPNALAARITLTHHERFDGRGYPHGLVGGEIPIAGRIVAVADVLDALLSERPYRPALAAAQAVELLVAGSGGHFDPAVVEAAIEHAGSQIV